MTSARISVVFTDGDGFPISKHGIELRDIESLPGGNAGELVEATIAQFLSEPPVSVPIYERGMFVVLPQVPAGYNYPVQRN